MVAGVAVMLGSGGAWVGSGGRGCSDARQHGILKRNAALQVDNRRREARQLIGVSRST